MDYRPLTESCYFCRILIVILGIGTDETQPDLPMAQRQSSELFLVNEKFRNC